MNGLEEEKNSVNTPVNNVRKPKKAWIYILIIVVIALVVGGVVYYIATLEASKNIPAITKSTKIDTSITKPGHIYIDSSSKGLLKISWDSVGANSTYELSRSFLKSDSNPSTESVIYSGNATSYTDSNLISGTTYFYSVRVVNGSKYSRSTTEFVVFYNDHSVPVIKSFSANPKEINSGESTTITWQTQNATNCVLDRYKYVDYATEKVSPNGSKVYSNVTDTAGYILLCYDDEKNLPDTLANLFSKKYVYGDLNDKLRNGDGNDNHYAFKWISVTVK